MGLLRLAISETYHEDKLKKQQKQIQFTQSSLGSSPLHFAVLGQNMNTVQFLLPHSDVDIANDYNETPLHWACRTGNSLIVSTLIANGADINFQDSEKNTPLHWAAEEGHQHIYKMLKKAGANSNAKNMNHQTPKALLSENRKNEGVRNVLSKLSFVV